MGETGEEQRGFVHKEFVLAGQTINFVYYCDVLRRMHENVRRFLPRFWRQNNWLLHHDSSSSHALPFTREFFYQTNMTVDPYPSYFSPFPRLKIKLKGRHFNTMEAMEAEPQAVLDTFTGHDFQYALKKNGRSIGQGAYAQKGTTSRVVVAASRLQVSF
jgi:hypothetical protein